jgi:hypothetical protein
MISIVSAGPRSRRHSPALTKATLMGTTTYMTGSGANDTLYSNNQGMGRVNLDMTFDSIPRFLVDETQVFGATGETYIKAGSISSASASDSPTSAATPPIEREALSRALCRPPCGASRTRPTSRSMKPRNLLSLTFAGVA